VATGNLVTPRVAKRIDGVDVNMTSIPMKFNPTSISEIRKGMYDVCNTPRGTAYRLMHNLPIIVAGKTGTSQVTSIPQAGRRLKESELAYFHRSHAWITTYAPYDNPQFVVTVLIEHGGHGGSTSAPMAGDIYRWLYKNGYIKSKLQKEIGTTVTTESIEVQKKKEKIRKRNEELRKKSSQGLSLF